MKFLFLMQARLRRSACIFFVETNVDLLHHCSRINLQSFFSLIIYWYFCENGRRLRAQCPVSTAGKLSPQCRQKIANAENKYSSIELTFGTVYFPHEVRFSAAIEAAYFPADLRNAALSAFEEGAPFMGTALAAYKQSHWGRGCLPFSPSLSFSSFYRQIFGDVAENPYLCSVEI